MCVCVCAALEYAMCFLWLFRELMSTIFLGFEWLNQFICGSDRAPRGIISVKNVTARRSSGEKPCIPRLLLEWGEHESVGFSHVETVVFVDFEPFGGFCRPLVHKIPKKNIFSIFSPIAFYYVQCCSRTKFVQLFNPPRRGFAFPLSVYASRARLLVRASPLCLMTMLACTACS